MGVNTGEWEKARILQEEVLAERLQSLGDEHPDTLESKHELALILRHFDEGEDAKKLEQEILEVEKRLRGDDHVNTFSAKFNLAMTLLYLGEKPEAKELLLEVHEVQARVLGADHYSTQETQNVLDELATLLAMAQRLEKMKKKGGRQL